MKTPMNLFAEPKVEKSLVAELLEKSRSYHGTQEFLLVTKLQLRDPGLGSSASQDPRTPCQST